jgi:hypothetical protein
VIDPDRRERILVAAACAAAGAVLVWTACAVADIVITWRAFSAWALPDFTFASFLASRLFGIVREQLPVRYLKYEGHLQALLILSRPALAAAVAAAIWAVRRGREPDTPRRRVLTRALAATLVCLPVAAVSSYAMWQCVFVSPKEMFEKRVAARAQREGRHEPTTDEMARASELGYDYDEWRRESFFRLFLPYRPAPEGDTDTDSE